MERSHFGDPQPIDAVEMQLAIEEKAADVKDLYATIEDNSSEPTDSKFHGWTAEVRDPEGNEVFSTVGYADKDKLIADLRSVGITEIEMLEE